MIQPRIQSKAVALEPFLVVVSVLFGATLFGIMGALLAVPVAAAIQIAAPRVQPLPQRALRRRG